MLGRRFVRLLRGTAPDELRAPRPAIAWAPVAGAVHISQGTFGVVEDAPADAPAAAVEPIAADAAAGLVDELRGSLQPGGPRV